MADNNSSSTRRQNLTNPYTTFSITSSTSPLLIALNQSRQKLQSSLDTKANLQLFDKQSRHKQQLIYSGYYRLNIGSPIPIPIPTDIHHLIYHFYELTLALYAPWTKASQFPKAFETTEKQCLAIARLLRDQKEYFIAYDLLSFLLKSNPKSSELHAIIATVLSRWNCYRFAESEYKMAINIALEKSESDSDSDSENVKQINVYRYNYGLLLEKEEKYAMALEQFSLAYASDNESEYLFESAYCYQMLRDFTSASAKYQKCIEMNPKRAIYHEYFGIYLCQEFGALNESKLKFEKAIALEPKRWQIYYSYGRCLRDYFKDFGKAKECYLKAIEMNESKGFIHGSYAYLLYQMREFKECKESVEKAIVLDCDRPFTHYYHSLLLRKLGLWNESERSLLAAVNMTTVPKAVLRIVQRMKKENPNDIEQHRTFEILLRAKYTAMKAIET